MDVPISIGVILATALSLYETITGGGPTHIIESGGLVMLYVSYLLPGRALDALKMRTRTPAGNRGQPAGTYGVRTGNGVDSAPTASPPRVAAFAEL